MIFLQSMMFFNLEEKCFQNILWNYFGFYIWDYFGFYVWNYFSFNIWDYFGIYIWDYFGFYTLSDAKHIIYRPTQLEYISALEKCTLHSNVKVYTLSIRLFSFWRMRQIYSNSEEPDIHEEADIRKVVFPAVVWVSKLL